MQPTLTPEQLHSTPTQFITFEGVDGGGKSTQLKRFGDWLYEAHGLTVATTREPGGSPSAENIRKLLLEGVYAGYEALLAEHPHRMVRIDATGSKEDVQARIQEAFWAKLERDFNHLLSKKKMEAGA